MGEAQGTLLKVGAKLIFRPRLPRAPLDRPAPQPGARATSICCGDHSAEGSGAAGFLFGEVAASSPGTPRQKNMLGVPLEARTAFVLRFAPLLTAFFSLLLSDLWFWGRAEPPARVSLRALEASDIFSRPLPESWELTGIFSQRKPDEPVSSWCCISIPQ